MIVPTIPPGYFYSLKFYGMKKISFLSIGLCFSGLLIAQVKPVTTPVVKQPLIAKPETNKKNIQLVPAASAIKQTLPATVNENLIFYKWKATRWFENAMWKGEISAPDFTFNGNGTVSCSCSIISEGGAQLLSGTYTVNGNNVTIIIKQDTSAILTSNLVYDNSTQKLNGSFNLQILKGYAAGNSVQTWMKMEINPN